MGLAIVMAFCFRLHLQSLNKKAKREEEEQGLAPGSAFRYLI